jgi:hypothetical protein
MQKVRVARAVGVLPSLVEEVDAAEVDGGVEGAIFAEYIITHASWKFCSGFAKAWQKWHASICIKHKIDGFKFCRENMLCDCCKYRFDCYTREYR